ncbi:MAG: AAA family ATPase, partial [Prevotellaceae bacterium]|nr:AAA family ATPase [Prevotellaceae bacterium]
MMLTIRKLPIGIQDFEDLRTNGYVYVDKTSYLYRLATFGKPYFLGRPR